MDGNGDSSSSSKTSQLQFKVEACGSESVSAACFLLSVLDLTWQQFFQWWMPFRGVGLLFFCCCLPEDGWVVCLICWATQVCTFKFPLVFNTFSHGSLLFSVDLLGTNTQETFTTHQKMLLPYTGLQQHCCLWVGSGCREPRVSTSAPNRWHHLRFSSSKSFKLWPRSCLATRASCSPAHCSPGGSHRRVCL